MKPWTPDDIAGAREVTPAEARAIAGAAAGAPRARRGPRPAFGSLVGLGLSLAFVAGLAWALSPDSPVAREVRR